MFKKGISSDQKKIKKNLIQRLRFFFTHFFPESFRDLSRDFFENQIARWLLILSLVANLANWILLKTFIQPVDLPIILHYNVYFGVDILGNWKESFFSPTIGLIILIINFFLALYFYKCKERIISHILLIAALMIQLSMLIYSTSLIVINY